MYVEAILYQSQKLAIMEQTVINLHAKYVKQTWLDVSAVIDAANPVQFPKQYRRKN